MSANHRTRDSTRLEPRPAILAPEAIDRARSLRDLTDPAAGPHAMQILLDAVCAALTGAWGASLTIRRDDPVISVHDCYDALRYAPDAITREARYTRYVSPDLVLRTHTTAMIPPLLRRMAQAGGTVDALLVCPGLVYRRDSIDRLHVGEPHQCDVWRIRRGPALGHDDLREMIGIVLGAVLPDLEWRCEPRAHPYTLDGLQVDVCVAVEWIEVLECGLALPALLDEAGLDTRHWSGLALGMGLDRVLMLRKGIDDIRLLRSADRRIAQQMLDLEPYRPVSNQPPIRRDLSVAVDDDALPEELGDRVRAAMGADSDALESLDILDQTPGHALPEAARARIGLQPGQKNVLLRLAIRHPSRTLTAAEANRIRDRVYGAVHQGKAWQWATDDA
ncbi:MAG: hypothetical protein L0271_17235 [Gemmatimonadetes bacterium]|nr:hypothetical protein [Gemmatimonadota bacterium]